MSRRIKYAIAIMALTLGLNSCVQVKAYQKMYVNDRDMDVNSQPIEQYEQNMQIYREGAAGANGGKSGGGCACN